MALELLTVTAEAIMKRRSRGTGVLAVLAGLALATSACRRSNPEASPDQQPQPPSAGSQAAATKALAQDYVQMAQMYQQMAGNYDHVAMGQDARWMSQMHDQMTRLHQYLPDMTGAGAMGGRAGMTSRDGMMGGRGGMMGGTHNGNTGMGAMMGSWSSGMDRWHDQMAHLNDQWATREHAAGHEDIAQLHREIADLHRRAARDIETRATPVPSDTSSTAQLDGAALYTASCAACHGEQGQGVPGAFPALAGNSLFDGPADRVIDIVRHGLTGPTEANGSRYNGVMPSFEGRFASAQLAAILTYLRGAWGNHGSAVTATEMEGSRS